MTGRTLAIIIGIILLGSALGLVAYYVVTSEDAGDGGVRVVVTIAPQEEFVREVGGDLVSVTVMVPEGREPHTYEPTPSQMKAVARADIYFMVGSGVEFEKTWMDNLEEQNGDMLVVDGSEGVTLTTVDGEPLDGVDDGHEADANGTDAGDEGDGHDHTGADPHIWMSLRNAKVMVENLLRGLKDVDPDNAATYGANAESYIGKLEALDRNVSGELEGFEGAKFLVYHPSFGYFARDYGLVQVAVEEEGKEPGTAGLAALIDQANDEGIRVVFVSPQFDAASASTIADDIGGRVITIDSLAGGYLDNIAEVAGKLADALGSGEGDGAGDGGGE